MAQRRATPSRRNNSQQPVNQKSVNQESVNQKSVKKTTSYLELLKSNSNILLIVACLIIYFFGSTFIEMINAFFDIKPFVDKTFASIRSLNVPYVVWIVLAFVVVYFVNELKKEQEAKKVYDKILSVKGVGKGSNDPRETIRKIIALKKAFRTGKIFRHAHDFDYNMSGNWGKECHEALMMALESSKTRFDQAKALFNFSRIINMDVFETLSDEDKIKIRNHLCSATNFEDFFKKLNSIKSTTGVSTTGKMWMELFNVGFGICEYANVVPIIEAAKAHIVLKSGGLPEGVIIVSAGIIEIIGPIYPGVEIYANRVLNSDGYAVISNEVTSAHKDSIFDGLGVSVAFGDSITDFFRFISINFGSPKPGNNFPSNSDFHFTDNTNYPASEVIRILEEYFSS